MKIAVVNYASGSWYPRGQKRLRDSLVEFGKGMEFIGFDDHRNFGSPPHGEVPYAFKTFALKYCMDKGYDAAIFADSSIFAVKPWKPVVDILMDQGYYVEEAGHLAGTWTKDSALERLGIDRDAAMKIPMFSAGFTCLNFRNKIAVDFLERWHSFACDGDSFKGTWGNENGQMSKDPRCKGHRHDMSIGSIVAWQMGMKLGSGGHFLAYIGKGYGAPQETVIAHLKPC